MLNATTPDYDPRYRAALAHGGFEHLDSGQISACFRQALLSSPFQSPSVLDFGCGGGGITRQIAEIVSGNVVGFDTSEVAIRWARMVNCRVNVQYTSELSTACDQSYNVLHDAGCAHIAENEGERRAMFSRYASLLVPQGIFLLVTGYYDRNFEYPKRRSNSRIPGPAKVLESSEREILDELELAGFSIRSVLRSCSGRLYPTELEIVARLSAEKNRNV